MILIDWPQWPAHGRLWAHLISDTSLRELHEFARGAGVPARAFDLDHYDVPAERIDELVRAGAVQVTPRELVRRLHASGLRVPGHRRPDEKRRRRDHDLQRRWRKLGERLFGASSPSRRPSALFPEGAAPLASATSPGSAHPEGATPQRTSAQLSPVESRGPWEGLGAHLLTLWSQPHRRYHHLDHLHDVLGYLDTLAHGGELVTDTAVLAAWFHDAVYQGRTGHEAGLDEEESARLAEQHLPLVSLERETVAETARLVRATATHEVAGPGDPAAALLDADLAVLAAPPVRYAEYTAAIRVEYEHVPERLFREGRAQILERFLEREHLYVTLTARDRWEEDARANVAREIAQLRA